eukprot:GSChrysophyteH1.ASY1.ANO1.1113.1 assembled CDS
MCSKPWIYAIRVEIMQTVYRPHFVPRFVRREAHRALKVLLFYRSFNVRRDQIMTTVIAINTNSVIVCTLRGLYFGCPASTPAPHRLGAVLPVLRHFQRRYLSNRKSSNRAFL